MHATAHIGVTATECARNPARAAELCVKILAHPAPHISKSYELTGSELKDMHEFAEDYAAAPGRQVTSVPEEVGTWNEHYVDNSLLAAHPHIAEHLKSLTRLVAGGRYGTGDQLETLLGRPPKTVRWALENNPRLRKLASA